MPNSQASLDERSFVSNNCGIKDLRVLARPAEGDRLGHRL